jgi:choline dehydrogenase-like flavoprotein
MERNMAPTADHYDLIVIGSGPGGASLAQRLAPTGKRILMLERGDYLPRSRTNWDSKAVFVDAVYQAKETWHGHDGSTFHPGLHYFVGGNSKVYGAALFRLRERDFAELRHKDGISPAWPLGYDVFEPYYTQAEALFHVHGQRGEDPTEPWCSAPYAHPPVIHEPRIQQLSDILQREGLHPFHLPLGIKLEQNPDGSATTYSPCIRCDAFDGFPCAVNAKADAQVICVDPTRAAHPNFTLLTNAYVTRLETDAAGRSVSRVHVTRDNRIEQYSADIVVAACGALNSALLLLRSASDAHPDGLANGSDQVGRNYIRHEMSVVMALLKQPNRTVFQKTLALSDFYFGADDWHYPLGLIQMCATSHGEQIRGEAVPGFLSWLPEMPFEKMAEHSMDFWLQTEDLPHPDNRIRYDGDRVVLELRNRGSGEAARRLKAKLEGLLGPLGAWPKLIERSLYLGKDIPIGGTAHQAGTCRFGTDPASSVLDLDCKAHQIDNLYVVDAGFFPSIGAVNPTLTIIANALRVADRIKERLGA